MTFKPSYAPRTPGVAPGSSESPIVTDAKKFTGQTSNDYFYRELSRRSNEADENILRTLDSPASVFDVGSTRGTRFIPGYQGFIPCSPVNAAAVRAPSEDSGGYFKRIVPHYQRFMPGYTGVSPDHVLSVK